MDKKKDDNKTKQKKKPSNKLSNTDKKEIERLQVINKELTKKIETLTESEEKAKKESLLHMAELENFKKRKTQEVDAFKKHAAENVISAFLPVIDNFVIACEHSKNNEQAEADIIQGFVLIQKQIENTLEKLNITTIESLNQPFNPDLHQAIGQEKKENTESNTVIKEVQKGFKLHDKIIRPAMVIVSE